MNLDFQKSIIKKYNFDYAIDSGKKNLHIAYGVDKNFLFGAGISITSVLIHNSNININFHIFTDYVDDEYIENIQSLAKLYSTNITVYVFNNDNFKSLPSTKFWTYAMYYRYMAFEYLSASIDSVLYLDADVVCKGSLGDFTQINFGEKYAAVVNDIDVVRLKSGNRLNIPELTQTYFNSGVVLANLAIWKEKRLLQKAFDILINKQKELLYFDQDVLNILFVGNVILLQRDFNCIYSIDWALGNEFSSKYKDYINENTVLIHYVGVTKPWHRWASYPASKYFLEAYKKSSWSSTFLLNANTAKLFKRKSRHERLQKKYVSSIFSHIMYIKTKLARSAN